MSIRATRELNNSRGSHPARGSETSPVPTAANAPTTAARGSATRSHPKPQSCPCCEARQSSDALGNSDPNGGDGRRLRRITIAWFGACVFAMVLLWQGVAGEAQRSELLSESDHDRGAPVTLLGNEPG